MQLMIYVGGTLVLLIFGVMLTAQAPFITMRTRSGEWVTAVIAGSALLFLLVASAMGVKDWQTARQIGPLPIAEAQTATAVGAGLAGVRVDRLNAAPEEVPAVVLENTCAGYLLPFVIVSVHLLVVLVGAAYLARTKSRRPGVSEVQTP
jgi:NADH:ubiquinone oxidoreductase subunit 6 (subunit J)